MQKCVKNLTELIFLNLFLNLFKRAMSQHCALNKVQQMAHTENLFIQQEQIHILAKSLMMYKS